MTNTIPNVARTMKKCAACRTEKPVSEMKTCMHNQMHNYVCDSKCMHDFYNPPKTKVAPSPAGVDGLDVVSNWVLFDAEADKPYIKKMLPEGFLAFFDCEEDARRAKANNTWTDYKRIDRVKAEDAQAIIDGLRGEVAKINSDRLACWAEFKVMTRACLDAEKERDQHAKRIGELEGLLRACHSALYPFDNKMLESEIDAALAPSTTEGQP